MANNLKEFISYLKEQVRNHSIYVWGAQGQLGSAVTEAWIRRKETDAENCAKAIAFWKKQCSAGYGDMLRAFDCSGLGMFWLQNVKGLLKSDTNANGLYRRCRKIGKAELRPGDFVFKVISGKATHIGYVVDTELNVIEAQGRDYGVVKRALSEGAWNAYGRPGFWTEAEINEVEENSPSIPTSYVFSRILKYGCRGEDVVELKKLLTDKGYGGFEFGNKNFLSLTKKRVKAYQKDNGLEVDGIAGPVTITALGGRILK